MENFAQGLAYGDRRHAVRLAIRQALAELLDKLEPDVPLELALEILVESAVGFRAWDQNSSHDVSLQVGRLARRVRDRKPIEV